MGKLNLAVVYGSAREKRFGQTVGQWVLDQLQTQPAIDVAIVDPRDVNLSLGHAAATPCVVELQSKLTAADAFIVITPEYNHGYPAALKLLIDSTGAEWQAKPVAFVSYGGVSGGLRAVEQLRLVFAELHAVTVRNAVSFANAWQEFDDHGSLRNPARSVASFATMMAQLAWWAQALKAAKSVNPYGSL